jgi:DNA gyrase subunit A
MVSKAGLAVRFEESAARAMGRDTGGVRGMEVGKGEVIAMDVARDDMDLLTVTEAGYGKRTRIDQYRKTNRGTKGVLTIKLTEAKGGLAGALVVRPHHELVFISQNGMVQRTGARGISQQGRTATGVRVMNVREDDRVSAVALIVESDASTSEVVAGDGPIDLDAAGAGDLGREGNGAAPDPEASLDPEMTAAADLALDEAPDDADGEPFEEDDE